MKKIQLTALTSIVAATLALVGCQSPSSTTNTTQVTPTTTTNTTTTTRPSTSIRTLSSVTCNDQSVNLNLNQGGIAQQGTLQGYKYCEYQIPLKAGQHLNVQFDSPSTGAYVIVYDRTDIGDTQLVESGYTATTNEVLPVRVLLTRNVARSGNQYPFSVQFNLN